MRVLTRHLLAVAAGVTLLFPALATAQEKKDDPATLSRELDELQQQIKQLSDKAEELRHRIGATAPATATEATAVPPSDDLLNVQPIEQTPPATAPTTEPPPAVPTDTSTIAAEPVNNVQDAGASKVFNPDMSVIGNFIAHAGDTNPYQPRDSFSLDEAELALEAFVDPYAKAKFFLGVSQDSIAIEEGYAQFVALPFGLTAKAGKMKATFGKDNTWHTHVRPWADQPLVIENFFGEEGLADSGISVSKIIPNPFAYTELTGEVFRGKVDGVFDNRNQNDLFYNSHLKLFKDLSENSNLEAGVSVARGTADSALAGDAHNSFGGVDLTYRWKPLSRGTRRSFIGRTEVIQNHRGDQSERGWGFYSSADYQFAQRWFTGVRIDRASHAGDYTQHDRGAAVTLTFWPSEFSQLRGELRRIEYPDLTTNELLLQLQFSIGAHGAHTF